MKEKESVVVVNITDASVRRVLATIFGYAFVGMISLLYGITLQMHNYGKEDFFLKLGENYHYRLIYLVILIVIVLLNLLFCHSHTLLYLEKTNIDKNLYAKFGHWIETLLLIIVMAYFVPLIIWSDNKLYAMQALIVIGFPWCLCVIYYRTFLLFCRKQEEETSERIKYKLIIPSMLLVAVNIYSGSCLMELIQGKVAYYLVFIFLITFIIVYCWFDYIIYVRDIRSSVLEQKLPMAYYSILCLFTLVNVCANYYWSKDFFDTPIRSLFLASFVTVYMAMFEGWFLLRNRHNIHSSDKIKKVVSIVLDYMPMIIFVFFPFQRFQLVYYIGFVLGHIIARQYWNCYQKSEKKKSIQLSRMRAILGTLTLIVLIIDKWYPFDIRGYLGVIINTDILSDKNVNFFWLEIIVGIIAVVYQSFNSNKGEKKKLFRCFIYLVLIIVINTFVYFIKNIDEMRIFLSIVGCLIFLGYECYLTYGENQCIKAAKKEEKEDVK